MEAFWHSFVHPPDIEMIRSELTEHFETIQHALHKGHNYSICHLTKMQGIETRSQTVSQIYEKNFVKI